MADNQASKQIAACGSWQSPIGADMLAAKHIGLAEPALYRDYCYWLETRPAEQGRSVVVRYHQGIKQECTPRDHSVRSGVHEYGGGAWTVSDGGLFYVNSADQAIYRCSANAGEEVELFFARSNCRYADLRWVDALCCLIAVEEEHQPGAEPTNRLVALAQGQRQIWARGADFYSSARVNPNASQVCWLAWSHPQMPWFGCELWLADIQDGKPVRQRQIAGGTDESIFQPDWFADDLYFCSDRNQRWQLHRWRNAQVQQITHFEGECGLPQWQFGMQSWCADGDQILCAVSHQARWSLYQLNPVTGATAQLQLDASLVSGLAADANQRLLLLASPTSAAALWLQSGTQLHCIEKSMPLALTAQDISLPQAISAGDRETRCHAFYYPPANCRYAPKPGERPPLLVICHGGPTAATAPAFNLKVQFWTSRGFAVADVNYRGSTGYGRSYREALDGRWGLADAEDACNIARELAARGLVDADRLIIRGSSAGGLTVLSALTFHAVFAAGASLYGIGDLKILVSETHKFEARYGDRLIAPWPEKADEYQQRSPLHHIDQLNCPVIFFQGLLDRVVPPNQASLMYEALLQKGVPTAMRTYPNEGHGFRSQESIVDAYHAELAFYGTVLGFATDSPVCLRLSRP